MSRTLPVKSSGPRGERIVISARVSQEASAGWKNFCEANGISLASFLEVAGRELGKESFPPSVTARRRMVEAARRVDLARRSRDSERNA